MKKILLALLVFTSFSAAATRFAVGCGHLWSATAMWSTTSGGAGGSSVPTSADSVIFDALTCAVSYTDTISVSTANAKSVIWGNPLTGTANLVITTSWAVAGYLSLPSGMSMTGSGGTISFSATSSINITTSGVTLPVGNVTFSGTGTYNIQDDFTKTPTTAVTTLSSGTLDLNGKTFSTDRFSVSGSTARALIFHGGTIKVASQANQNLSWTATTTTNLTFTADSGSIVDSETVSSTSTTAGCFDGGGLTYNTVRIIKPSLGGTFCPIIGANTFNNLILTDGGTTGPQAVTLAANQIITGTFTASGTSATKRVNVYSSVPGTQRTITAAAVSISNADFQDIIGAGAATWTGSSLGDGGNNTGITFTTPVTRYWVGDAGSYTDNDWSATSGGAPGATVPLIQDLAVFDANSFSTDGFTFTVDLNAGSLDFTGVTKTTNFNSTVAGRSYFGDVSLTSKIVPTTTTSMVLRKAGALKLGGASQALTSSTVTVNHPLAAVSLTSPILAGGGVNFTRFLSISPGAGRIASINGTDAANIATVNGL